MRIKMVKTYNSAFDALNEHYNLEPGKNGMSADDIETLRFFDAFDGLRYTVIVPAAKFVKHKMVIVSDDSGIVVSEQTIDEFLESTMQYIRESEV